jgi:hypothetical protein
LFLWDNDALPSLARLESLTSVGDLYLQDHATLASLDGIDQLGQVGNDLHIDRNDGLTDVAALYGVVSVGNEVTVTDNPNLGDAAAQALVDQIGSIGGGVTISGNQ